MNAAAGGPPAGGAWGDMRPDAIVVIGGGVSGLAAAHRLRELAPHRQVLVLEASHRLGGVLATERQGPLLIERSADMFTTKDPAAVRLAERLGLAERLIATNEDRRGARVVRQGRLLPVPKGFVLMRPTRWGPIWRSPLLSPWGKLRMFAERLVPGRSLGSDESLRDFVVRRFGRQAFDRLVQPLIGGIYTADPEKLSMQATMAEFVEMERRHGRLTSLPRNADNGDAAPTQADGARYGAFLAPRDGMQELIDALSRRVGEQRIRLGCPVSRLEPASGGGWLVWREGVVAPPARAAQVILAVPAHRGACLLRHARPGVARLLDAIPYAGVAIGVFCFRREQLRRYETCFGFVAPAIERRRILAASFASEKFPGRAPDDEILIRVFLGGALQADLLEQDDATLLRIAREELAELIGAEGEPRLAELVRWPRAMPQYHVGHPQLVRELERLVAECPGLAVAGHAYHGVGIPACIRSGEQAAEQLLRETAASGSDPRVVQRISL